MLQRLVFLIDNPPLILESEFEGLRRFAAGYPFANTLLDFLNQAVDVSISVREMIKNGINATLVDKADRYKRTIDEHYTRETDGESAAKVGERMAEAFRSIGLSTLADKFLDPNWKPIPKPRKKKGIDQGPGL
jgi:hypothetical protein